MKEKLLCVLLLLTAAGLSSAAVVWEDQMTSLDDWTEIGAGTEEGDDVGRIRVVENVDADDGWAVRFYSWWSGAGTMNMYTDTGYVLSQNNEYTVMIRFNLASGNTGHNFKFSPQYVSSGVWNAFLDPVPQVYNLTGDDDLGWQERSYTFDTTDMPAGSTFAMGINAGWNNAFVDWYTLELVGSHAEPTAPANEISDGVGTVGDAGIDVLLEWDTARDPNNAANLYPGLTAHYVYVVENEPNFLNASPVTVDAGAVGETGSLLLEDLAADTVYYWRVDESVNNDANILTGPAWGFLTIPEQVVLNTQPQDVIVQDGGSADFSVDYFSAKDATFTWYQSADLNQDPFGDTIIGPAAIGANSVTLTDISLADGDEHTYVYCVANNGADDVYSEMALVEIERLVGHWEMDDNLTDSKNGWTGSTQNPTFVASDISGSALVADKTDPNGLVTIDGSEEYFDTYHLGLTASAWIKTTSTTWGCIVGKQVRPESTPGWDLTYNASGVGLQMKTSGGNVVSGYSSAVNDDAWHLVTGTYDPVAGVSKIYIDGELEKTTASPNTATALSTPDTPVTITAMLDINDGFSEIPFDGLIDDVRIYNYPLDGNEVLGLYNEFVEPDKVLCLYTYGGYADIANADTGKTIKDDDFEPDCVINLYDLSALAEEWLSDGRTSGTIPQ